MEQAGQMLPISLSINIAASVDGTNKTSDFLGHIPFLIAFQICSACSPGISVYVSIQEQPPTYRNIIHTVRHRCSLSQERIHEELRYARRQDEKLFAKD